MGAQYINYVGPPQNDIWEVGQQTTDVAGNQWLCTGRGFAQQPGTTFELLNGTPAPPAAASVVAPSYSAQTASVAIVVQNTLGTGAEFVGYFTGAASVATFRVGVGPTSPPPTTTVTTTANVGAAPAVGLYTVSCIRSGRVLLFISGNTSERSKRASNRP